MAFIKNLSVFIPRIHAEDANEEFIKHVFFSQEIASVRRVDLIKRMAKGKVYYNAKIHFHYWFKNQIAYNIQQRMLLSETSGARIIYDDPWYWIVLKNKKPMTENELCINERLEHIEKYMSNEAKKTKKVKKQIKHLSAQLDEQNQFLESLHREMYLIVQQNEKNNEDEAEATANQCAEHVLQGDAEELANECAEFVLEEEDDDALNIVMCNACVAEESKLATYLSTGKPNYVRTFACWGGDCINSNRANNNIQDSEDEDDGEMIDYDEA